MTAITVWPYSPTNTMHVSTAIQYTEMMPAAKDLRLLSVRLIWIKYQS
jgi:hypothetical protein